MGKFRQILIELSAIDTPIFSFPDDNWSKCQGILTKPSGMGLLNFVNFSALNTIVAEYYPFAFLLCLFFHKYYLISSLCTENVLILLSHCPVLVISCIWNNRTQTENG